MKITLTTYTVCNTFNNYENHLLAGNEIHLLPGFHAYPGSKFTASINPSLGKDVYFAKTNVNPCTGGNFLPQRYASSSDSSFNSLQSNISNTFQSKPKAYVPNEKEGELQKSILVNESDNEINIFPNPTSGFFQVTCSSIDFTEYEVRDTKGLIIDQGFISSNILTINLSNSHHGIYFLVLIGENQRITKKVSIL